MRVAGPSNTLAHRQTAKLTVDVRFVPKADIRTGLRYFRRSSTGSLAMLLAILRASSRVSKSGLRIAGSDSLIESFGLSFCFYEYREILAGL
jgi:hypothetical protein